MKAKQILSCAAGLVLAATGAASAEQPSPAEPEVPPEVEPGQPSEPADQPSPDQTPPTDPAEQQPEAQERSAVSFDVLERTKRQELQSRLAERGFYDGPIDGQIDEATRDALSQFQQSQGIEATGHLDAETSQALGLGVFVDPDEAEPMSQPGIDERGMDPRRGTEPPRPAPERQERGTEPERGEPQSEPQSEQQDYEPEAEDPAFDPQTGAQEPGVEQHELDRQQVEDMQRELQELGYYDAEVDGIYGPMTREALQEFQADRGIEPTGEVNEQTLRELGIDERGSEEPGIDERGSEEPGIDERDVQPDDDNW